MGTIIFTSPCMDHNKFLIFESKYFHYNIVDIVDRSAKIILNNITHLSFKNNEPDILIEPPIDQFRGWDFHRSNELIKIGYEQASKVLDRNESLFQINS